MSSEEDFVDDEYIEKENDPFDVEKVSEDNTTIEEEEVVGFDPVFGKVRAKIADFTKYDQMMAKKLLDDLKKGRFS